MVVVEVIVVVVMILCECVQVDYVAVTCCFAEIATLVVFAQRSLHIEANTPHVDSQVAAKTASSCELAVEALLPWSVSE